MIPALNHSFTGLRHGLPVVGHRIIEADQLQHLVMLLGKYCIQLLPQGDKAWLVAQIIENGVIEQYPPSQSMS